MKVYIDTGIFIDYFVSRGHRSPNLRSGMRRGRNIDQLSEQAEDCLSRLSRNHYSFTSSMTFYEVEEVFYQELSKAAKGITHGRRYVIPAARSVVTQMLLTVNIFKIKVIDLTMSTIERQIREIDLQIRGLRSADSLHVTSALMNDADIILSADKDILSLDGVFRNASNNIVNCWDTDTAILQL